MELRLISDPPSHVSTINPVAGGFSGGPAARKPLASAGDTGSIIQEDSTCHRAAKPGVTTTGLSTLEPVLCHRGHHWEKPKHMNWSVGPRLQPGKPKAAKTQRTPK